MEDLARKHIHAPPDRPAQHSFWDHLLSCHSSFLELSSRGATNLIWVCFEMMGPLSQSRLVNTLSPQSWPAPNPPAPGLLPLPLHHSLHPSVLPSIPEGARLQFPPSSCGTICPIPEATCSLPIPPCHTSFCLSEEGALVDIPQDSLSQIHRPCPFSPLAPPGPIVPLR